MESPISGSRVVPSKKLHRQGMMVVAAISAVVLVAAVALVHTGSKVGLLQAEPVRYPFENTEMLARSPVWNVKKLEHAKYKLGQVLAQDMRKMFADRSADKKKDSIKGEDKQLKQLKEVEMLKARYDAIEVALAHAPQLQMMQGASAGQPGELLVQDPRTGQIYLLYEYHVPGGYLGGEGDYEGTIAPSAYFAGDEKGDAPFQNSMNRVDTYQGTYHDYAGAGAVKPRFGLKIIPANRLYEYHVPGAGTTAEYLGGDGGPGVSDYDAAPSEYFATDEKGDAPFTYATERHDSMQGTYHDYAGGGWTEMKPKVGAPQLYEYHTPGEYAGGEEDYDGLVAPSEYFATDEKGDAPFGSPVDRVDTYQGTYHDYAGGEWVNMKAHPQMLARAAPMQVAEAPEYVVMRDHAGQLRLVNPRAIQGLEVERMAQLNAQRRMAAQILAMRNQRSAAKKPAAKKQSLYYQAAEQAARDAYLAHHPRQAKVEKASETNKKASVSASGGSKADAQTEMLAQEAFDSSTDRTWGKVYEPKLVRLSGLTPGSKKDAPLSPLAAKEFKRWNTLAQKVTDVYDPMKSNDENMHLMEGHNGNWWSAKGFEGHTGHQDTWWVHNKDHAENKAY